MTQLNIFGEKKERWFCINCSYSGYEHDVDSGHEVCPKCGWVVYSESEVEKSFLNSNLYPKLIENYKKVKGLN